MTDFSQLTLSQVDELKRRGIRINPRSSNRSKRRKPTQTKQNTTKKAKYFNKKTVYNGVEYDSKSEARYARNLDLLKKTGEVLDWVRQVPFVIIVNNVYIAKYVCDFVIAYDNGDVEYIDVKGFDKKTQKYRTTTDFKLKKKLVEAIYCIEIKLAHA